MTFGRNDPFDTLPGALSRPTGHIHARSRPKMTGLLNPLTATGIPLGGIGTGGITRASDGRFSRWTIKGGGVRSFERPANGFALRAARDGSEPTARALQPKPQGPALSGWTFEERTPGWEGLFPMAWHRHDALDGISAECLSFSPFIAGDLDAATLPVALFRWRLTNHGEAPAEASIAFHFANMNGWFGDFGEGDPGRVRAGLINQPYETAHGPGIALDRRRTSSEPAEGDGQWGLAVKAESDARLSRSICLDGSGDGERFWQHFLQTGDAPETGSGWVSESGFRESDPALPMAALVAALHLAPGESREVTFALVWDLPVITFGQGRRWHRAYTDRWGVTGTSAATLAEHALEKADEWQARITRWHDDLAAELGEEPHCAAMAINELYFLVDGLTVFTSARNSPDGRAHFGLIECHDYGLYNTLDLWIYAAEAVGRFFPELAASVAQDFADHLLQEDLENRRHRWDGSLFPINAPGACPHDLGGPGEDPFVTPNSYTYRDSTIWKDLNCDLVLCIWREGERMGPDWRRNLFPTVRAAIDHLQRHDRDGDGMIENDGHPDQTFDNIPMLGPSSYCGGLWIAALSAAAHMAEEVGDFKRQRAWRDQAKAATEIFNSRLWNGRYFRVDTDGPFSEACFIEQLLGPFLARCYGLGDIVPQDHAVSALKTIFAENFVKAGSEEGAVSLANIPQSAMALLPHSDDTSFQTAEIQPGFNFSLAAQLEEWGLAEEADRLRRALHRELHVKRNLAFQTPAAIDRNSDTCRAILNMRPLAVWWMKGHTP